jgi:hypothetical protein
MNWKDLEGIRRGLRHDNISTLAKRYRAKHQKTLVDIAGVPAEIRSSHRLNTKSEALPLEPECSSEWSVIG